MSATTIKARRSHRASLWSRSPSRQTSAKKCVRTSSRVSAYGRALDQSQEPESSSLATISPAYPPPAKVRGRQRPQRADLFGEPEDRGQGEPIYPGRV